MPVNPGIEYKLAEKAYLEAKDLKDKIKKLENMLRLVPKHKSSESLQKQLKQRLAKLKKQVEAEKKYKKGRKSLAIKKEGAAQVVLFGTTNTGKSTLLKKLTNANVEIQEYEFTTKKPEFGIMDYNGIKIQIIEIPAITKDFYYKDKGPLFLGIVREVDLIVLMFKNSDEKRLLLNELKDNDINIQTIDYSENIKEKIWKNLNLIYVYTKMPGKKKDYPPVALKNGSVVEDLAIHVHKDFIKKFRYARVWGKSAKFNGQTVGLKHILDEGGVVELHMK